MSERDLTGNHSSTDFSPPSTPSTDSWVDVTPPLDGPLSWAPGPVRRIQLYALTAHEESGINRLSTAYAKYLVKQRLSDMSEKETSNACLDLAYTLCTRRTKLPWKAFLVSSSPERLSSQFQESFSKPKRSSQPPNITFAFSGQGAQWYKMGRELLQYKVFESSLETADRHLQSLGCEWSLMTELSKDEGKSLIDLPRISQPLCTALQVALVDLLDDWGVKPQSVVGHSSGEIAATYTFGVLSREDAWKLSYHRGRLTSAMKYLTPNLRGRMMAVALSPRKAEEYLSKLKLGLAIVACINSPESVTISGDESAVLELEKLLKSEGVFARLLKVNNAYHSSHMRIIERHYLTSIKGIQTLEAHQNRMMFSSVTGKGIHSDELGPSYWAQNLVSPVKFSEAFASLLSSKRCKPEVILEIGPHGVLQGPIKQILDAKLKVRSGPTCLSILSRSTDAVATSLEAVGQLWSLGLPVDLEKVNASVSYKPKVLTDLPTYPWNHTRRYWHESHLGSAHRFRKYGRMDLIGAQTADSISEEPRWRGFIRVSENPWVEDHQVQNTIIYPAAGIISMALEAARQLQDENREIDGYEVANMHIDRAMILPTTSHGLETALNAKVHYIDSQTSRDELPLDFTIYSKPLGAKWVEHAHGSLTVRYKKINMSVVEAENARAIVEEHQAELLRLGGICTEMIAPRQLYETLESIGMKYGPTFQNITSIGKKENSSCTSVKIPDTASRMPAQYEYPHLIHPATLDAMFQTVFVAGNEPMVPSFLESLFISADFPSGAGRELMGYSTASRHGLRDALGTIVMSDPSWDKPLLVVKNLHFTALNSSQADESEGGFLPNHHRLCAELKWKEDVDTTETTTFKGWLELLAFKNLDLNILEINNGDDFLMDYMLTALNGSSDSTPRVLRYTVAGGDQAMFESTQTKFPQWSGRMNWKSISGTEDVVKQGFKLKSFDLILTHSFELFSRTALSSLLKNGGRLLSINDSNPIDVSDTTAEGDRYRIAPEVEVRPASLETTIEELLDPAIGSPRPLPTSEIANVTILSNFLATESLMCKEATLILPENTSTPLARLASRINDALLLMNVKTEITKFSASSETFAGKMCISLLELETPMVFKMTENDFDAFRSVITVAKCTLWITMGGHFNCENPFSSPAATLCRTIRSEDPQKLLYNLDIEPAASVDSDATGRAIMSSILKSFKMGAISEEMEYVERGGKLLIPRVQLQEQLSSRIDRGDSRPHPKLLPYSQPERSLKLEIGTVGDLKSLCFSDDAQASFDLEPLDVEIEVAAVGVKMLDVKTVLGQTSNDTIGTDVSGTIRRVGSGVSNLKPGDRVIALCAGAYKSLVRVSELMCQKIPDEMEFDTAASLPSNLVISYYSLIMTGRLQKGESVLIHDGASALGQTCIQMAQAIGGDIFTTAGDGDRDMIMSLYDIESSHILEAESSQLTKSVRSLTNGQGFDLVLSNLPQDKLKFTWSAINPCKSMKKNPLSISY